MFETSFDYLWSGSMHAVDEDSDPTTTITLWDSDEGGLTGHVDADPNTGHADTTPIIVSDETPNSGTDPVPTPRPSPSKRRRKSSGSKPKRKKKQVKKN